MSPHFTLAEAVQVRYAAKAACYKAVEFVSNKNISNKFSIKRTITVRICHQTGYRHYTLTLHKTVGSLRLLQIGPLQNKNPKKVVENLGLVGKAAGLDQSEPAREK